MRRIFIFYIWLPNGFIYSQSFARDGHFTADELARDVVSYFDRVIEPGWTFERGREVVR